MRPATSLIGDSKGRQPAGGGDGLVGNRDDARIDEGTGLLKVGREMKIGEQDLARPHKRILGRLRLFHFDDHLGPRPDLSGAIDDFRARAPIIVIAKTNRQRHVGFDDHRVSVVRDFTNAGRRHTDPMLLALDLFGNANQHDCAIASVNSVSSVNDLQHLVDGLDDPIDLGLFDD